MPPTPPPCAALGPHCRELPVTLRIGDFGPEPTSLDHEATWLLGHTAQIDFGALHREGNDLMVDAVLRVKCRYLKPGPAAGESRCAAHGFVGTVPPPASRPVQPRRLGGDAFTVVTAGQLGPARLPLPARSLPVLEAREDDVNPCSIAPCKTADHTQGSACCRDMQLEIMCGREDTALEALVRSRQSPYLCKVSRDSVLALAVEMISACGYLDDAAENCTLHGRTRPDGRPAKPDLCSHWPDDEKGLHPGCLWWTPPAKKKRGPGGSRKAPARATAAGS